MSVKVAVRVRPFNEREMKGNSTCCVTMKGPQTIISDPATKKDRPFTFDYSFWSHDGFHDEDGVSKADAGSNYADQDDVYQCLGKQVLDNAWEGYHCCLFAYGQTGAGKSYSMVGYGKNKGIVPMACDSIFQRIGQNTDTNMTYQVSFSMLEIYNEKVQDLLMADQSKKPTGGLKVRESQGGQVYVQGLSKHPVDSYEMIAAKTDEGYNNRSIGSTLMNQTSSRAHTIITIEFKQVRVEGERKMEKFSVINLVDLAGSEKAGQTGATGSRLKEGCAINKSLTVLGTCISVLADKAMGKAKKEVVPYRDSNLTRILQNALGGNSKTIMICAISPASMNFEESVSTLRYADRAKKIQNKAVVNESAQEKLIRELRSENDNLKKLLLQAAQGGGTINVADLGLGSANDIIESMDHAQEQIDEIEKPWEQKLKEEKEANLVKQAEADEKKKRENKRAPHLVNINEDPQLSGKIYNSLMECPVQVGRKNDQPKPQIIFGGVSIKKNHGKFNMLPNGNIEFQITNPEAQQKTYINGKKLDVDILKQVLFHRDKIFFGPGAMLMVKYPLQANKLVELEKEIREQTAEDPLSDEEIKDQARQQIIENGLGDGLEGEKLVFEEYTDDQINEDMQAVDFDSAYEEVEKIEEKQRLENQEKIKEEERLRLQSEFEKKQQQEKEKGEKMMQELMQKQEELEQRQKNRELELAKQEETNRLQMEKELKAKEDLLAQTLSEQERVRIQIEKEALEKATAEQKASQAKAEQEAAQEAYRKETERLQVELEMNRKMMTKVQENHEKAINDQKAAYESKLLQEKQIDVIRVKMKDIRKDIAEANEIAKFMQKDIVLTDIYVTNFDQEQENDTQDDVQVKVENFETGGIYIWSSQKFQDKLMMMRDALQMYEDSNFQELDPNDDPFYEKQEPILLGKAFYMLEGLAYLMDNPRDVPIVATNNQIYGQLHINLVPCEQDGNEEIDEDLLNDDPQDLLNQSLDFKVQISHISNLPEDFCRDIYCEYEFYMDKTKYTTQICQGKNTAPQMNYSKQHHVDCVTQLLINHLLEDKMTIKIFGIQDLKKKKSVNIKRSPTKKMDSGKNDLMKTDPLRGMKGSYKNDAGKKSILGKYIGKK